MDTRPIFFAAPPEPASVRAVAARGARVGMKTSAPPSRSSPTVGPETPAKAPILSRDLRRSLVFASDTGITDGLRLRRRVAPESTRSTHRVTSPFPGSLRPETLHIHRPADLPDVYAGIGSDSRPYDAIFDVFPVLQPVPAELHALRLLLACSGRLF